MPHQKVCNGLAAERTVDAALFALPVTRCFSSDYQDDEGESAMRPVVTTKVHKSDPSRSLSSTCNPWRALGQNRAVFSWF
jgi:hypothetical protein